MVITQIKKAKRRPGLYEVHNDDGEVILFHEETILRGRIHRDREFTHSEWASLISDDQVRRCQMAAWEQISIRQTNSHTLTKTLRRKSFTSDAIKRVVEHLKSKGYLDDRAWAEQFVRERIARGEGPRLIENRLLQRGFDRELVREALSSARPDEDTERTLALRQLEKWNRRSKPVDKAQRAKAAGNWLLRRGFPSSIVWGVVRDFFSYDEEQA